ncbi:MAG: EAL domain-containing protein [Sulfurospirillaceae bacterium]|nr:EAL domain-containing protein [Sulfurospirillaceae bacterium]
MQNNQLSKLKLFKIYADQIVFMLIFLILFSLYVFYQLNTIHEKESNYIKISDTIHKLKLINSDFNNFFLNQKIVINYDNIKNKVSDFSNSLDYLGSVFNGTDLTMHINRIKNFFQKKRELIEKFKSYNAISMYSLIHILNLSNTIKNNVDTDVHNIEKINPLIDNSIYDLIKIYLNLGIDSTTIKTNLKKLQKQNNIIHNERISLFLAQINDTINKITYVESIKAKASKIPLDTEISTLNEVFNTKHNNLMSYQEKILYFIFFVALSLIFILLYVYIKSIRIKQDLLAFRYAVENSDDSIVITDKNRHITYINDAFVKISGYTKEEVLGQDPKILQSGELEKEFYTNMNNTLNRGEKWSGEFVNKKKNGEVYYEKSSITPMITDGKLTGYLAIKLDVTDYIKEQKKVEFLAYHDSLTTLPNRLSLKMILNKEYKNLKQNKSTLSLLFLDLDGFKTINDTLGHEIGDMVLSKIAMMIRSYVKEDNRVFRTGGDEFAILLSNKVNHSIKVATEILQIFNEPITVNNILMRIGVSIGIANYTDDFDDDIFSLIKYADMALYQAKKNGKNRYIVFNRQLSENIHKKMEVEQALSNALKNNEFYVVYQPKYNIKTKEFVSMEALIRWENEKLGIIPPDYFIPIAEDLSFIHEIGKFVFAKACEDFIEFKKVYKKLQSVSINVSASQLINKSLAKDFQNIIRDYNISANNIGIEITETHIMHDVDENIISLQKMKDLGFKIILDDFGTGYSSMSYLKKLPVELLKIDKSFIDNICTDINDLNIVKATIALSKSLGYKTIAEGIETKEQEDILIELGVDCGQGYLFSKPKTKEEFIDFIKDRS